jgi:hypothetical protein
MQLAELLGAAEQQLVMNKAPVVSQPKSLSQKSALRFVQAERFLGLRIDQDLFNESDRVVSPTRDRRAVAIVIPMRRIAPSLHNRHRLRGASKKTKPELPRAPLLFSKALELSGPSDREISHAYAAWFLATGSRQLPFGAPAGYREARRRRANRWDQLSMGDALLLAAR